MAVGADRGLLGRGDWALMGHAGVVHLAELVGGLPRGRSLCGAVGTAFLVSAPPAGAQLCRACALLAEDRDGRLPGGRVSFTGAGAVSW